jgi:hypothetical protein
MVRTVAIVLSLLSIFSFQFHSSSYARSHDSLVLRSYPEPGTSEVPTTTSIGITAIGAFRTNVATGNAFHVIGSKSGEHPGRVHLSLDHTTAIFEPLTPFALNETVTVTFVSTLVGEQSVRDSFTFVTLVRAVQPLTELELAAYPFEGALQSSGIL